MSAEPPVRGATATAEPAARPARRRRSLLRTLFYTVSTAIIVFAGFAVPLPLVETQPGTPSEIAPLVEIEGTEIHDLNGTTALLTVRQQELAVFPTIGVLLDGDRELRRLEDVYPPGIDRDDYLAGQRERFGRQFDVAAAVAARTAGVDVDLETAVVVVNVLPDSPADGVLERGDIVVAVDGEPLADAQDLAARTQAGTVGDVIGLTVLRDGEELELQAVLGTIPGEPGARLGVWIEDGVDLLRLPFEISLQEGTRIGGPSAGMMVAITVYDLLTEEDLLRGRTVVGTGTLGSDGTVGPVGGIPQKLQAAAELGADLVLVPQVQFGVAEARAPEGLTVVGVANLDEAIEVLRADTG